ncbi:MAG: LemA family protein [Clostridiales bacterium]|nr:LemA family protein [Clostridiales bacterium]
MKKGILWSIIGSLLLIILLGGGCSACSTYNSLVGQEESVDQAWANVENQYQRRADLIPNLVSTVKGYASHEATTFEAVTDARAGLGSALEAVNKLNADSASYSPQAMAQYSQAQQKLQSALGLYVNAVHEAYPDLKANENFMSLQDELAGTENRIATERTRYNESVKGYNVSVRRFPNNIFAGMFGFSTRQAFAAEESAQHAPKVEF